MTLGGGRPQHEESETPLFPVIFLGRAVENNEELLSHLGHCWAKPAGAAPKGVIAPILRNEFIRVKLFQVVEESRRSAARYCQLLFADDTLSFSTITPCIMDIILMTTMTTKILLKLGEGRPTAIKA